MLWKKQGERSVSHVSLGFCPFGKKGRGPGFTVALAHSAHCCAGCSWTFLLSVLPLHISAYSFCDSLDYRFCDLLLLALLFAVRVQCALRRHRGLQTVRSS